MVAIIVGALLVGAVVASATNEPQIVEITADFDVDDASRQLGSPTPGRSIGEPGAAGEPAPRTLAFADDEGEAPIEEESEAATSDSATETATSTTAGQSSTPGTSATADASTSTASTAATTRPEPNSTTTTTVANRPATTSSPTSTQPATAAVAPSNPASTTTKAPTPVGSDAVRVSTNGLANGGGFSNAPVQDALASAAPGTVFAFAPGQHAPLRVRGVRGRSGLPIVITAADSSSPPIFTDNSHTKGAAIELSDSSHVAVSHVRLRRTLWGVRLDSSTNIALSSLHVSDVGQEGVRVMNGSSHVSIEDSTISNTGNRTGIAPDGQPFATFGEGIYLGSGQNPTDAVHNIRIAGNDISDTGTEAIDVKPPVTDVEIVGNNIHDIRTFTSGAVVIHIQKDFSMANPNIRVLQNTITNITTSSPYQDGNAIAVGSSAEITGNTIRNSEHYGIRIEDGGAPGRRMTVTVRDNSISGSGQSDVWQSGGNARLIT